MSNMKGADGIADQTIGDAVADTCVASSESGISSSETNSLTTNASNAAQLVDIKEFIHAQLKENIRDRLFMLNIERDLINFLKNEKDDYYKFQAMNPYYRMLTHRICDYFGLGHNLDNLKQSVIVFKIADKTHMPLVNFQSIINTSTNSQQQQQDKALASTSGSASRSGSSSSSSKSLTPSTSSNNLNALQQEQNKEQTDETVKVVKIEKKQILKRDANDQENEALRLKQLQNKRSSEIKPKTFEEKSAEYNRIKNRIFNNIHENEPSSKPSVANTNQNQKNVQAQSTIQQAQVNQSTEVKQYKILNRPNKPSTNGDGQDFIDNKNMNEESVQNKPNLTNNQNGQLIYKNQKKNLNQNKPKPGQQQQQPQQPQQNNSHKKYQQNFKPVVPQNSNPVQQGAFRPTQMVQPFPPQQFYFMNQNPNFQQQFNQTPINPVMFPGMASMVAPSFQLMANQNPGLLMATQVPPFLQIPNVQNNSQKNSPARPSPKTRTKFNSPVNHKPHQNVQTNDKIKNIKFQVYNLSANLTRAKLNELLGPYVHRMEIVDKKANSAGALMQDEKNALLDEASIDILIEFDNFDKIEQAFKDLNLNSSQHTSKPFLIKPVC